MKLSLTISGSEDEMRHVLDLLEGNVELERHEMAAASDTPVPGDSTADATMHAFVRLLSPRGVAAVKFLADRAGQEPLTAEQFATALQTNEGELYGVLGGLGKSWAKVSKSRNPFGRRWSEQEKGVVWGIDVGLAGKLQAALDRVAPG